MAQALSVKLNKMYVYLVSGLMSCLFLSQMTICQNPKLNLGIPGKQRNRTGLDLETTPSILKITSTPLTTQLPPQTTDERLDLPQNMASLLVFLQRMNDRLTTIESLENQQLRKLETIEYRITKMEIISQEKSGQTDKPETRIIRKIEDLEWEMNKFGTLIDVIRQDIDKVHQRQMELKAMLNRGTVQSLVSSRGQSVTRNRGEEAFIVDGFDTEFTTKFQSLANNIQHLRKVTETMHTTVYGISQNLTDVNNITRAMSTNMNQLVTKQYFYGVIKELPLERTYHPVIDQSICNTNKANNVQLPRDCSEVQESGFNKSGVYRIKPQLSLTPFFAFCDLESDGGGWTVIQKRFDGAIDFFREWPEYKHGFGNAAGEHWLGNEKIHLITNQDVYQLEIELEDFDSIKMRAGFSSFAVGSESDGYMLKLLGCYDGNAGDSFTYHASVKFSTKDVDNDPWEGGNCAEMHKGGWWYKGCETANLNGQYLAGDVPDSMQYQGVYWYEWHGPEYSLQKTTMKIRPVKYRSNTTDEIPQKSSSGQFSAG